MTTIAHSTVSENLDWLRSCQNPDGGWPFHPGYQSWVEPTAYAAFALSGAAGFPDCLERAGLWLAELQRPDGSWAPCASVNQSHWSSSLCVSVGGRLGLPRTALKRGVEWLVGASGAEGGFMERIGRMLDPEAVEYNSDLHGWSWTDGTASWVEPTSHAIVALDGPLNPAASPESARRVEMGRKMLLDRRCADGGWNYGNRRVRGVDLPGYARTTANALIALAGTGINVALSIEFAIRKLDDPSASVSDRAWLTVALRSHGEKRAFQPAESAGDVIATSVGILAATGGHYL